MDLVLVVGWAPVPTSDSRVAVDGHVDGVGAVRVALEER